MPWAEENRSWRELAKAHWSPKKPESLRVRAWLRSPVACDGYDPLTLEGSLQYAVTVIETGRLPDDVFAGCSLSEKLCNTDIQVPIVDETIQGWPIAKSSAGVFSPDAITTERWRRQKPRAESYNLDVVKVSTSNTKSYNLPSSNVIATHVDFFVVGDRDLLKSLVVHVGSLGAKRSGGLGQVHSWEVLPTRSDWSIFGPQGRLMRTIPASSHPPPYSELREATLRAPYWHPRSRALCHVPVFDLGEGLQ